MRLTVLLACLLGAAINGVAGPDPDAAGIAALHPGDVSWQRLELVAHRFPFSATSQVTLRLIGPGEAELRPTDQGVPVAPGPAILDLAYKADLFGTRFRTHLLMAPDTGAALQYETVESGRRQRHRVFRFTDRGVALWTVRPADGESGKPEAAWSDRSTGFRPFGFAPTAPVLDPLGLLYVVSAARLGMARQELEIFGLAGREVIRLQLAAGPPEDVEVDYAVGQGKDRRQCRGKVRAVPVAIRPESRDGKESQLDFLGLSSDIRVLVQEGTHVPVRITGRASKFGKVTITLRSAVMQEGVACG